LKFSFLDRKSNSLQKRLIAGIAGLLIMGIVLLVFLTFLPKQNKTPGTPPPETVNYDSAANALALGKKHLRSMAAKLRINYFSRHAEASKNDLSFFMFNRVSELASKWRVELVSFSPAKRELRGVYSKITFLGEIRATYAGLLSFFQELEEGEKLLIETIELTSTSQSPLKHQAKFTLSCLEFTDQVFENLGDHEPNPLPSPADKVAKMTMGRDPFSIPPQGLESAETAKTSPPDLIDLSGELRLTGIISFPQPETAVIERTVLRKGDKIDDKEIMDIQKGRVILQKDGQRYVLKLKEAAPKKMISIHPLERD
jgi:hypothetical protein